MESFFKLYFGRAHARSRVIRTVIYLISITLIVNMVLEWAGLVYVFPKDITLAAAFDFVLSGQILYPIAGIILYYGVVSILPASLTTSYTIVSSITCSEGCKTIR